MMALPKWQVLVIKVELQPELQLLSLKKLLPVAFKLFISTLLATSLIRSLSVYG